jgi:hypothetical protein
VAHPTVVGEDIMLDFLLYLVALVCFLLAAFAHDRVSRVNLVALGLAAWVLVLVIRAWPG